jgi:hypothetical protein
MKHYSPTGRRNRGRPLKRLLDTWDRNGSTCGPAPWQIYDDDEEMKEARKDRRQGRLREKVLLLIQRCYLIKHHNINKNGEWRLNSTYS